MEELKKLFRMLEERLVKHDSNREEVQEEAKEVCAKAKKEADLSEARESKKIREEYEETEGRILSLVERLKGKLDASEGAVDSNDLSTLMELADQELAMELTYDIDSTRSAATSNKRIAHNPSTEPLWKRLKLDDTEDTEKRGGRECFENVITDTVRLLEEHLERAHETMAAAQDRVEEFYKKKRSEAEEFVVSINKELEALFTEEDARVQSVVNAVREVIYSGSPVNVKELAMKVKEALIIAQKYGLCQSPSAGGALELDVKHEPSLECIFFGERMPTITSITFTKKGLMCVSFILFNDDDEDMVLLRPLELKFSVTVKLWEQGRGEESATTEALTKTWIQVDTKQIFVRGTISAGKVHCLRMRIEHCGVCTQWSNPFKFTPEFRDCCVWKECPAEFDEGKKYSVDAEKNPRLATKIGNGFDYCTIIGNASFQLNAVTSGSIKVLKSENNDGGGIYVGVAPSGINQNEKYNHIKCGWYFYCCHSSLFSGPPHNYWMKAYGPRKEKGEYVHDGGSVGVVMDTAKGELSFVVNGVNLGVAYEGIPLDKPLVPCVILKYKGDSVELDTSEVKETVVDSSIPVPSNITAEGITWDSITVTWDAVKRASFYQIEVDGSKSWEATATNAFKKKRLLPENGHTFRVRAVRGNSVSEWSDVVKGKTQKEIFETSWWKECPGSVYLGKKYSVDAGNPRIATSNGSYCTIIGNTPLPPNQVTPWSIKVLKSLKDNGGGICIGVAPFYIDQNDPDNSEKSGWYFNCLNSTLRSGPPHNYRWKVYGLRKLNKYSFHTGDTIGVVMDATKGDLSFVVNEVNLGIAYEGIPLDKPLMPFVIFYYEGDSVELDTSEVKENVDSSINISNIIINTKTIRTMTLTWNVVEGASFYQIEVDGSKAWDLSATNIFKKKGLLPETEHTFRIRAVRGNKVGEWSDAVKGKTKKASLESRLGKECPDKVHQKRK